MHWVACFSSSKAVEFRCIAFSSFPWHNFLTVPSTDIRREISIEALFRAVLCILPFRYATEHAVDGGAHPAVAGSHMKKPAKPWGLRV